MEKDKRAWGWVARNRTMGHIRTEFESLKDKHGKLARKCKHRGEYNGYKKHSWDQCTHENMGWGGLTRNTNCELTNCPLIICK